MATKDTTGVSSGSGASLTTSAIAVAANSNRVLEFGVMIGGATNRSVTSIVRDGQSAVFVRRETQSTTVRVEIWRIIAPNTGSATALMTLSGSASEVYVGWFVAYDVDQASPSTTPQVLNSNLTTGSVTPTSTSTSDIVLAWLGWNRPGTAAATFGSGQAAEFNTTAATWCGFALSSKVGTGGADAMSVSMSAGSSASFIGYALKHAAAGSPPAGTVTISDVNPGETTAVVTYSYDDSDETGYEYRIDGGTAATIGASPATITGLTASTEYDVEVRATNADGNGSWSSVSTFTTDAPAGSGAVSKILQQLIGA